MTDEVSEVSDEVLDAMFTKVINIWKDALIAEFWRDGDGYIAPTNPVDEFMDEVRKMIYD